MTIRTLAIFIILMGRLGLAQAQDAPEVFPQIGHSQAIASLAFSPDGSALASGGADNTIKLWELGSGREIRTLGAHYPALSLAYSPDGRMLAFGTIEQGVKIVDVASGRELRTLSGHVGTVFEVAFSPDGRILASGGDDRTIKLWDVATWRELATFGGFSHAADALAFSPDGQFLAANSPDHVIRLWDVASAREVRRFKGYAVGRVAFSPDGQMIAAGSSVGTIKLWEVASGRELGTLRGHTNYVELVAFSPNGRVLVSSSFDRTVKIWDLTSGHAVATLGVGAMEMPQPLWATAMAFSPNGNALALGLGDGTLKLWDTTNWREMQTLGGHSQGVSSAIFSGDGRAVVFGSFDGTVEIWDAVNARQVRILRGHGGYVSQVALSPDGRVLASASTDHTIKLWDMESGRELRALTGHADAVNCAAFSPEGSILASGSDDRTIKLWDVASGRELRTLRGHSSDVNSVAFSPDGRTLASGSGHLGADGANRDNVVKLWDVASGRELRALGGHSKWVTAVGFSPDGTLLASASDDRTVKLWDMATGREVRTLGGFIDRISSVKFSPDGHTLAAGAHDTTVKLWDVATGNEVRTLTGYSDVVNSVAFSQDGQRLLTASWTSTVRIWDLASGRQRVSFVAFTDGSSVAITPEGYYSASSEAAEENLNVRVGSRVFPIAAYRDKFYRPDLVKLSLAGNSLTSLGFAGLGSVKVAPIVQLVDLPSSTNESKITVRLRLTDGGGGIGQVRLFLNGTAVAQDTAPPVASSQAGASVTRTYAAQLTDGPNALQADAYNAENSMHSSSPVVAIVANLPPATRASLHALVVGIQQFKNPSYNLAYPAKDAQLFAETLKKFSAPLFGTIDVRVLVAPGETTRDGLIKALKDMQAAVGPNDLFVFYVASHGITDDAEFYLITSNVGSASTEHLKTDALSKEELTALVANIHATKKLMVIDTCHAEALGNALQVGLLTRGLDEATALKVLSRAVGTTVLAASTTTQQALEGYEDHGLFTYVVAQGLMGKGDVDQNGVVNTLALAHYVDDHVPELAQQHFNHPQYPTVETNGQAFPLTKVR